MSCVSAICSACHVAEQGMEEAVMSQLTPSNIEINIVGDFDEDTLDDHLLRYLGTIPPSDHTHVIASPDVVFQAPEDVSLFHQAWHLKVSWAICAAVQGARTLSRISERRHHNISVKCPG